MATRRPGVPSTRELIRWSIAERAAYLPLAARAGVEMAGPFEAADESAIRYGDHREQRGLIWVPRAVPCREQPVVVYVHGGSWASGSPGQYRFVGRFFAEAGYPTVVLGYRHAPEFIFPAQREDVVAGVRVAVGALRAAGCPADRLVLSGHSAGAHLAALAVVDPAARGPMLEGLDARLDGAAFVSGPLDIALICPHPPVCPAVQRLMGGDEGWDAADPTVLLPQAPRDLPMLAFHGAKDPIVYAGSSASFVAKAQGLGMPVSLRIAPDAYHANLMGMFLGARREGAELLRWLAELE